ncbi:MAG: nucleotide pyrophosphohydrolase, partial [Peptococcaceae bacterium]|nr:nucleotide pyrophosphohydrolase [Peptococcaceae bacterium]
MEYNVKPITDVMNTLLGENGCPWDKEQTHDSLRKNLLEEAHEVIEAIDSHDMVHLKEELGDVLLQVVFHAKLAEQEGQFNFNDVVDAITEKMIRR